MNTLVNFVEEGIVTEPLQPQTVVFYEDEIIAVQQHDGAIYVLFSRMCENLGRPRVTETRRVEQHAVLVTGFQELAIQTSGGPQNMWCLRLDLIPLWLASIPSTRLKDAIKKKLVRYQTEAATVLWETFKAQIIAKSEDDQPVLVPSTDEELVQLTQIAAMGRAITQMAEEQLEMRRRIDTAARVFKVMRQDVTDVQVRLGVLEDRLHPAAYITEEQATQVSTTVKALAEVLTRTEGKNQYQSVFAELYRRFGVSSYKLIRQEQYEAVLAFLEDWRAATTDAPQTPD